MAEQASSSRACSSPAKAPTAQPTGMRSPTKLRTPTKLVRPRETHWASKAKDVKKRLLDAGDGSLSSALPPPKRIKLSGAQPFIQQETSASSREVSVAVEAVEASLESKEDDGYTGYTEGLQRQVEVAQCLEEDLLRDNARMRLKALSLRDEVDFYYRILAKIELVAAQQTRRSGDRSKELQEQVTRVAERLQRIISASKPTVTAAERESDGDHTERCWNEDV